MGLEGVRLKSKIVCNAEITNRTDGGGMLVTGEYCITMSSQLLSEIMITGLRIPIKRMMDQRESKRSRLHEYVLKH